MAGKLQPLLGLALVLGGLLTGQPAGAGGPSDEVKQLRMELATTRRTKTFLETRLETCKNNAEYWRKNGYFEDFQGKKYPSPSALAEILKWDGRASDTEDKLRDLQERIAELEG